MLSSAWKSRSNLLIAILLAVIVALLFGSELYPRNHIPQVLGRLASADRWHIKVTEDQDEYEFDIDDPTLIREIARIAIPDGPAKRFRPAAPAHTTLFIYIDIFEHDKPTLSVLLMGGVGLTYNGWISHLDYQFGKALLQHAPPDARPAERSRSHTMQRTGQPT